MHFNKVCTNAQIQRMFLSAKINANPYNYKISNKLIFEDYTKAYKYNMAYKHTGVEEQLIEFLDYDDSVWESGFINLDIINLSADEKSSLSEYVEPDIEERLVNRNSTGLVFNYNDIVINEVPFISMCTSVFKMYKYDEVAKKLYTGKYLEAYLSLYHKCINSESLIPYLIYAGTKYKDRDLEELVHMKHIQEMLDNEEAPIVYSLSHLSSCRPADIETLLLSSMVIPEDMDLTPSNDICMYEMHKLSAKTHYQINVFKKLGLLYSMYYMCEILYQYDNVTNEEYKNVLSEMFETFLAKDGVVYNHFYKINALGMLEIEQNLKDLFCKDNSIRFKNFKNYVNNIVDTDSTINKFKDLNMLKNTSLKSIPIIMNILVRDCHQYAYQKLRVDIVSALYLEAKRKGFKSKDFNTNNKDGMPLSAMLSKDGCSDVNLENENAMMDLFEGASYTDDNEEPSGSEFKKTKSRDIPTLESLDNLKNVLDKSRYKFNINHIKSSKKENSEYRLLASELKMMSKNLTKQIKDIKTYNTGGKMSGLSRGKLDRKNLWKYKTSPEIFFTNEYKIKEMDLAFGIILDMSGSMYGTGIKDGRIVLILLHEVLNSLRINHAIMGHNSNGMYQSNIHRCYYFNEEKEHSLNVPYSITNLEARNGNCDSGALYYMQQLMHNVRNKDKICIIFSDGSPTECSGTDLRNQVRDMEREGIHVIGVGINFESIKNYYNDYANGKNLQEMIDIVVKILTKYVLEKKD